MSYFDELCFLCIVAAIGVIVKFLFMRADQERKSRFNRPWYRVALMSDDSLLYTTIVDGHREEVNLKSDKHFFVEWLTDRIYYDVPRAEGGNNVGS